MNVISLLGEKNSFLAPSKNPFTTYHLTQQKPTLTTPISLGCERVYRHSAAILRGWLEVGKWCACLCWEWLRFSCVLSTGNVEDGWWTYVIYDCKHLHRRLTMQLVSTSTAAVAFTSTATCTSAFGLNAAAITKSLGVVQLIGCPASRAISCSTPKDWISAFVFPHRMVAAPIRVSAPAAHTETLVNRHVPEFERVAHFADFCFVSHLTTTLVKASLWLSHR